MDSKDSFNKLGCTPVHLVPSTPSKDSSLSTQTIFAPSYLANTKRKRKTRYRNEWQQVQEIVNTRFIRGRRPMTNQEHGIPAQSLVEKERRLRTQTQKSQTLSFKVNHQTKNQKTKPCRGLSGVSILWTMDMESQA